MGTNAFAIVGMRRSGTSSLSLVLNKLGVSFGDESQLLRGNEFNEEGYWEHRAVLALHRRFRGSMNLVSLDCDPTPEDWRERPATEHFLVQGVECIRKHFLPIQGPWAWKDPDASLALPFAYEAADRAGVKPFLLISVRHPMDVARSEFRRKGIPEEQTIGSWLAHTVVALWDSRGRNRAVVLFSDLVDDPKQALQQAFDLAELQVNDDSWADAKTAMRRDLVHNQCGGEELETLPPLVQRVFRLCELASKDIDDSVEREIESCYREFEATRRLFWRPTLEEATLIAFWERGSESFRSELVYRPTTRWQELMIDTGALPASQVRFYLYPLPASVWIRRAQWIVEDQVNDAKLEPGRGSNLTQRFGLLNLSLLHGQEHLIVRTPASKGPFSLRLELLIETNNLVVGETYKFLSERVLKL